MMYETVSLSYLIMGVALLNLCLTGFFIWKVIDLMIANKARDLSTHQIQFMDPLKGEAFEPVSEEMLEKITEEPADFESIM